MTASILVVAEVYLPGYQAGGPVRSLANLVESLGKDYRWKVITTDRDFHAKEPYESMQADVWTKVGNAEVYYARPQALLPHRMLRLIADTPCDALYLNSFFSPRFSIMPVLARCGRVLPQVPALIAPRGEFSQGARSLKRWKKMPFVRGARLLGFYRSVQWHASTELEAEDIVRVIGAPRSRIHVARNLGDRMAVGRNTNSRSTGASLRVCFLSRVARNKNLDFALRVLCKVERQIVFTVYGPIEDARYWEECMRLVEDLPPRVSFEYKGALPHEQVRGELERHDIFFLPTRGENYGHVLVEAWCAGLPVLTSDQTPWGDLEANEVGWSLPLDSPEAFVRVISDLADWQADQWRMIRSRCHTFMEKHLHDGKDIDDNRRMFERLLGRRGEDGHA